MIAQTIIWNRQLPTLTTIRPAIYIIIPALSLPIGKSNIITPAAALTIPKIVIMFFFQNFETSLFAKGMSRTSGIYEAKVAIVVFFASLK